jgi:hypothetical protein
LLIAKPLEIAELAEIARGLELGTIGYLSVVTPDLRGRKSYRHLAITQKILLKKSRVFILMK